ncbi:uncharacterized protein LOC126665891 [Mercurialis annua]|uniref:uncharacterized protein LOC126665891 n=1 Tax=Mercurialis annua TaxID=3986 RepID=UPI00215F2409|nr:uncharacterized protein LOC126665891 [Mercurialis annua]
MEKKRSWICTLGVQVCLCVALYVAINLGHPYVYVKGGANTSRSRPLDVYFISVGGGYRDIKQQTHLLKLMEKVARVYKAKFVVNISELGEDDPLTKNASRLFSSMNVPWYTTSASKGLDIGCFQEQINVADTKMLTIAGVDTESLQDLLLAGSASGFGNNQLNWLMQALQTANSNWLIVVGYYPVVVCGQNEEKIEEKEVHEPLHHIFMKYGVNAYISKQSCTKAISQDGVTYLGISDPVKSKPSIASLNGSSTFEKEMETGFLLHRVSSLEIATYLVNSRGMVVNKVVIRQRGKEFM